MFSLNTTNTVVAPFVFRFEVLVETFPVYLHYGLQLFIGVPGHSFERSEPPVFPSVAALFFRGCIPGRGFGVIIG